MADALGTGGSPSPVSAADHRLAQAGQIAPQTSTLDVRKGVMWGPGATTVVTGTSATGTMTVNVAAHHWVASRATGDGVYLGTKESSTTVNIAAAPGSNSRIDVVYSKQNDSSSTISADGSSGELYGVVTGTAAASPTKPALPTGAVEIATVQIASGTTNTLGAGATITNTAALTVTRGSDIPVRNTTERDALTLFVGLGVIRLDAGGRRERWNGTRWVGHTPADVTIGDNSFAGTLILATGPSWNDILSFTGSSTGGECVTRFNLGAFNGNSGIDRTAVFRVICDSTTVWSSDTVTLPLAGNASPTRTRFGHGSSTPAAGAHTWKIQGQASAASSVVIDSASITVVERAV